MIRIRIIIRSEKEPDMETPDRPQGAEHRHAVCSLETEHFNKINLKRTIRNQDAILSFVNKLYIC